jgi:hypothetical protein
VGYRESTQANKKNDLMNNRSPYPQSEAVVPVATGIIFSLLTCGIYLLFWHYRQMKVLNAWLGREELNFWVWFGLSIITCGIFAIYYEYKMAQAINEIQENHDMRVNSDLPVISVLLSIFSLSLVSTAIQQADINKFYGENPDI